VPYLAVYAASKAFVLSFSEALWAECRRRGVRVVAVCPGPVETQFGERAGTAQPKYQLRPEAVVAGALRALERDQPSVVQRVPGFGLVFAALAAPVVPRRLRLIAAERLARWFFRQQ
jgi:short-subunit dehydrogenase